MLCPHATVRSEYPPKNEEKHKLLPRTHLCHFEFGTPRTPDYIYIPGPITREQVPVFFRAQGGFTKCGERRSRGLPLGRRNRNQQGSNLERI
jgi:hypothetical protein